ncbi:hypothetical protein SNE40_007855 [Patella caerulea]|uniref:Uncharacterized protein n=1 Tax=Patella caerulea TaxID=87958 RepID=A0AAN8K6X3_PATCE
MEVEVPIPAKPLPVSPVKTSNLCLNCKIMRNSLNNMQKEKLQLQKEKSNSLYQPSPQTEKKVAVKTLTQSVKCKNVQLSKVKCKYTTANLAKDLKDAQKQLSELNKKHKMMKKYNKQKRVSPQL